MSWAADVHRATSCERHRECLSERLSYRPATVAVAQGSGASAGMSRAVSVACAYSPALPANRCVRETLLRQGSSHGFSFVPQAVSAVVAAPAQAGTSARTAPVFVSCVGHQPLSAAVPQGCPQAHSQPPSLLPVPLCSITPAGSLVPAPVVQAMPVMPGNGSVQLPPGKVHSLLRDLEMQQTPQRSPARTLSPVRPRSSLLEKAAPAPSVKRMVSRPRKNLVGSEAKKPVGDSLSLVPVVVAVHPAVSGAVSVQPPGRAVPVANDGAPSGGPAAVAAANLAAAAVTKSGLPAAVKELDVEPWVRAARTFKMNTDFDVSNVLRGRPPLELRAIMEVMKAESACKRTIQALADKLMLSQILINVKVPNLPTLFAVREKASRQEITDFFDEQISDPDSGDIIVKPTHLSSGSGVCCISKMLPEQRDEVVEWLLQHMDEFLKMRAAIHESLALQSLRPGFVVQPRYRSTVAFKSPLELRVLALWGKVRMGIWWWGRDASKEEFPQRNAWLVRHPVSDQDELSDADEWKVIHGHSGKNAGFDKAIELFRLHMPTMVTYCEKLATAVGAPFLRADFFVGSPKWGVRLNEVAYGCGCDYRNCTMEGKRKEKGPVFDDAPAMARILQEGMKQCQARRPPQYFLSELGVQGEKYSQMVVAPLDSSGSEEEASDSLQEQSTEIITDINEVIPEELCRTPRARHASPSPGTPLQKGVTIFRGFSPPPHPPQRSPSAQRSPVTGARRRVRSLEPCPEESGKHEVTPTRRVSAGVSYTPSSRTESLQPVLLSKGQRPRSLSQGTRDRMAYSLTLPPARQLSGAAAQAQRSSVGERQRSPSSLGATLHGSARCCAQPCRWSPVRAHRDSHSRIAYGARICVS